ncbi:MAG: hypothetical protein JNK85_01770 [Verrucomicrobiales bacterium]|nr:hypothetical protein [Verrucomicrobiales bacterium]
MSNPPILTTSKQRLITIYLDNSAYVSGKALIANFSDKHGLVEEHLETYLREGWRIAAIHGFGGNSDALAVRGWFAVVLEMPG